MKARLIRFSKSDLFKTSVYNGFANLVRILTSLVSNKVVALYLGPAGVALMGQFQNFTSMAMQFATVGIANGVTKYTAEYYDNANSRKAILSTGFFLTIGGSLLVALVIFLGRHYFCETVLHSTQYTPVFVVLAVTIILFALNSFLIAVLNGHKEFRKIVLVNISTSIVGLLIAVILVIRYGVFGAFIGVILSQTLVFFITLSLVVRSPWFNLLNFTAYFDRPATKKLLKFSLMAFTSVFAVTFVQFQIRSYIITHLSLAEAGYWQGVTRISEIYLLFITSTLGIYYLPRLSEAKTNTELRREIIRGYKFLLPLAILSSLAIYLFRRFITNSLFATSFGPMEQLFLFQMIGNIFKIASWLLAYLLIAKAMTKKYIVTEVIFGASQFLLAVFMIGLYGIVGATYSYCITYWAYLITMMNLFRKILVQKPSLA